MAVLYLAALIFGLGTIIVQLFMGGEADADTHLDAGGHAGLAHGESDSGFLPIFLSLRFWTFGLLAFGMLGSLLHHFGLGSLVLNAFAAGLMGLGSGALASWIFRVLGRQQVSSGGNEDDAVGQVGKVLIGVARERNGKVRVQLRGQTLDLIASTDEALLDAGEEVLIEEMRDGRAHVSKVPHDFSRPS